jgi:hypothetical protein
MRPYIIIYFMMLRHDFRNGVAHTKSLRHNRAGREREGEFDDVCAGLIVQKIDFAYGSGHYDSYFDKQFQ